MTAIAVDHPPLPRVERDRDRHLRAERTASRHLVSPRVLVAALLLAAVSLLMTSVQAEQPVAVTTYTVQAGDTLWAIAADVTPSGADIRATVATVQDLNDLKGSTIQPGQILRLPAG